ncbi:transcriptional regulator [Helicobacter sp. MIT 21-1697]|uniref:transcriptional regulator n=1 Tax=Helicobacter sp. MIT 21-1697 TaxID=2993733 RepID=UPI00224A85C3|nr:transcriptional regulator [Helicobacter sp. MIT 21-1697]MCX2717454.1 transcriptional regulator [Helicobacter sp. MIT 21-1697]
MPTTENFKDFVLESLSSAMADTPYTFSAKKMFGEYCIYVLEREQSVPKPIFLLCDEALFVKQFEILKPLLESAPLGIPYPGAKESYILDVDSHTLLREVVLTLAPTLPPPKPKKPKKK